MDETSTALPDLLAHSARRLLAAGVCIGHHQDNAMDEARSLVLHALHLPNDWPAHLAAARLLPSEVQTATKLIDQRIEQRIPAAYLIGYAEFAGLRLKTDKRALVPRSPIAELVNDSFIFLDRPAEIHRVLDLCTGGGAIALAIAAHHPQWLVDGADLSIDALALAQENRAMLQLEERVELIHSDLFEGLAGRRYELIVSNPPYLSQAEFENLPAEYGHEPGMALPSGRDGLDITLRMLAQAPEHLSDDGLLVVEIGEAERALRRALPDLPCGWIEFSVGQMGVFALTRPNLVDAREQVRALIKQRSG